MLAIPVDKINGREVEVLDADVHIMRVFKNARYYEEQEEEDASYTQCFLIVDYTENDIEEGFEGYHYMIEDTLYNTAYTNNYKQLLELHNNDSTVEQFTLF